MEKENSILTDAPSKVGRLTAYQDALAALSINPLGRNYYSQTEFQFNYDISAGTLIAWFLELHQLDEGEMKKCLEFKEMVEKVIEPGAYDYIQRDSFSKSNLIPKLNSRKYSLIKQLIFDFHMYLKKLTEKYYPAPKGSNKNIRESF